MYILYKVSEPTLTINTKFTLLNVESKESVTVGLRQFVTMIDNVFNVMSDKGVLRMTDCDIADFFKKSSNPYTDCNMVFAEVYSEEIRGNNKIAGYEYITKEGKIKFILADNINLVNALNRSTYSLQNANYAVKNNRLILSSKGEYPFLMHEKGYGMKVNADRLLAQVIEQTRAIGIPCSDYINPHITSVKDSYALGKCVITRHLINGMRVRKYEIKITDVAFKLKPQYIIDTLAHEVIHTCPECNNHGCMFKLYADKMNSAYGYNITVRASEEKSNDKVVIDAMKNGANYLIRCTGCGITVSRNRMSNVIRNPQDYNCKRCGSSFERIR